MDKPDWPIYLKATKANSVSSLGSLLNQFIINSAVQWRNISLDDESMVDLGSDRSF